jgi:hypothetical protein
MNQAGIQQAAYQQLLPHSLPSHQRRFAPESILAPLPFALKRESMAAAGYKVFEPPLPKLDHLNCDVDKHLPGNGMETVWFPRDLIGCRTSNNG